MCTCGRKRKWVLGMRQGVRPVQPEYSEKNKSSQIQEQTLICHWKCGKGLQRDGNLTEASWWGAARAWVMGTVWNNVRNVKLGNLTRCQSEVRNVEQCSQQPCRGNQTERGPRVDLRPTCSKSTDLLTRTPGDGNLHGPLSPQHWKHKARSRKDCVRQDRAPGVPSVFLKL